MSASRPVALLAGGLLFVGRDAAAAPSPTARRNPAFREDARCAYSCGWRRPPPRPLPDSGTLAREPGPTRPKTASSPARDLGRRIRSAPPRWTTDSRRDLPPCPPEPG